MKILKIFNNNIVQALNDDYEEVIAMGKGIGFGKKPKDTLELTKVDKLFIENGTNELLKDLYKEMNADEVEVILAIIDMAQKNLDSEFNPNLYVTLADHLHYTYERFYQDIEVQNPLYWEIKKMFPREFNIGMKGLDIIEDVIGIRLHNSEAASIAIHIINAVKEGGLIEETIGTIKIIQNILNLIRQQFGKDFDENSMAYSRFITHLQYFAYRVYNKLSFDEESELLYSQVKQSYLTAFNIAVRVADFIALKYSYEVSKDELVYLTIHIERVSKYME